MKRWFVAVAVGLAGCGGSDLQRTSATVRAPKCPKSISPGPRAAAQASRALFASLPKLYPTLDRKGATIQGMVGLAGGLPSSIHLKGYTGGPARKACGRKVIESSWVAWVFLPNNNASAARHVTYLVNTKKGWRVWYEWNSQNPKGTVVDV
jgi:hypothetical protein